MQPEPRLEPPAAAILQVRYMTRFIMEIKERSIPLKQHEVQAILAGHQTQLRRIVKPQPCGQSSGAMGPNKYRDHAQFYYDAMNDRGCHRIETDKVSNPYGQPGHRLWVRETYGYKIRSVGGTPHESIVYRASEPDAVRCYGSNGEELPMKWKPSIFMPRRHSRITLEIVSVRVERLLSISDEDAIAEGCNTDDEYSDMAGGADVWPCQICDGYQVHEHGSLAGASEVDCHSCNSPKKRFNQLWQSINGFDSWDANPWVWVVEFKVVEQ